MSAQIIELHRNASDATVAQQEVVPLTAFETAFLELVVSALVLPFVILKKIFPIVGVFFLCSFALNYFVATDWSFYKCCVAVGCGIGIILLATFAQLFKRRGFIRF